jgi:hypothetical protein
MNALKTWFENAWSIGAVEGLTEYFEKQKNK